MNITNFRLNESLSPPPPPEEDEVLAEDGTVGDLGIAPTGHKREPYHSLDIHDDFDEDDGW